MTCDGSIRGGVESDAMFLLLEECLSCVGGIELLARDRLSLLEGSESGFDSEDSKDERVLVNDRRRSINCLAGLTTKMLVRKRKVTFYFETKFIFFLFAQ